MSNLQIRIVTQFIFLLFYPKVKGIMSEFENDPKIGTKIPEDLLAIIKNIIVGKWTKILLKAAFQKAKMPTLGTESSTNLG